MTRAGRAAFASLLAAALAGCGRAPAPPPPKAPVRVAGYYWPGCYWVDVADRKGWFAAEGVQVQVVDTNADYFASFDDLVAGKLDLVGFTLFDLVGFVARGHDLVFVMYCDTSNGIDKIVARPGVERLQDLAGRRLGVPANTYLEYEFEAAARQAGLDPGAVTRVDIAAEKAAEALARGDVDAVAAWEPFASAAMEAAKGKVLFDSSQIRGLSPSGYVVRRAWLNEHRAEMLAILRAWDRAMRLRRASPDEFHAIVAGAQKQPVEDVRRLAELDLILDRHDNELAFSFPAGFDSLHSSVRRMNDFLIDRGLTRERVDPERVLDPSLIRGLAR